MVASAMPTSPCGPKQPEFLRQLYLDLRRRQALPLRETLEVLDEVGGRFQGRGGIGEDDAVADDPGVRHHIRQHKRRFHDVPACRQVRLHRYAHCSDVKARHRGQHRLQIRRRIHSDLLERRTSYRIYRLVYLDNAPETDAPKS